MRDTKGRAEKVWRTICIDPPWSYTDKLSGFRGVTGTNIRGADSQYTTMRIADIAAIDLGARAADDAHLYLWTTNAFMVEAHELARAWGFRQRTIITWVKTSIGMGHYFRNSTEHVLFCVRGQLPLQRKDLPTHFVAPRGRHSEKPQAFYDMVEMASPGPYLDVFARKQRMGWDCAGNEVYSVIPELSAEAYQRAKDEADRGPVLREGNAGAEGVLAVDGKQNEGRVREVQRDSAQLELRPPLGIRALQGDHAGEHERGSSLRGDAVRQPRSPRSGADPGEREAVQQSGDDQSNQNALSEGASL